jgi:hypothetical protein
MASQLPPLGGFLIPLGGFGIVLRHARPSAYVKPNLYMAAASPANA